MLEAAGNLKNGTGERSVYLYQLTEYTIARGEDDKKVRRCIVDAAAVNDVKPPRASLMDSKGSWLSGIRP